MAPSSSQKEVNYQALASDEPEALTSSLAKPPFLSSRAAVMTVPIVVTFTIALILGWVSGQHFSDRKWDGLICKDYLFDVSSILGVVVLKLNSTTGECRGCL